MVTMGILPFRENSHGRTGNRTRDLMISRQRLWPLDHEAGLIINVFFFILQLLPVLKWELHIPQDASFQDPTINGAPTLLVSMPAT